MRHSRFTPQRAASSFDVESTHPPRLSIDVACSGRLMLPDAAHSTSPSQDPRLASAFLNPLLDAAVAQGTGAGAAVCPHFVGVGPISCFQDYRARGR